MLKRPGVEPQIPPEIAALGSIAAATGQARTSHDVAASALEILRRSSAADTGVVLFDDGDGLDVEASFGFPAGAVEAIVADTAMSPELVASMEAIARVRPGRLRRRCARTSPRQLARPASRTC